MGWWYPNKISYVIKENSPLLGMGFEFFVVVVVVFLNCWSKESYTPHPNITGYWSMLLVTFHNLTIRSYCCTLNVIQHGKIKLVLNGKPHPYWLLITVLKSAICATKALEEKCSNYQSHSTTNPESYHSHLPERYAQWCNSGTMLKE